MVLVPVAGALVVGLMARFGSEKIRGHGIPEALEAILLGRSRIQLKVAILKPLSAAISIGTGGPFGAEGPIIMTGGAFGSMFAQQFHLSAAERKTLLVAGAAAGMSAVFATPVAAVLLAVELLAVRMEAAQLYSRGGGFDCRLRVARAVARRGTDFPSDRRMRRCPARSLALAAGLGIAGRLWLGPVDDAGLRL